MKKEEKLSERDRPSTLQEIADWSNAMSRKIGIGTLTTIEHGALICRVSRYVKNGQIVNPLLIKNSVKQVVILNDQGRCIVPRP